MVPASVKSWGGVCNNKVMGTGYVACNSKVMGTSHGACNSMVMGTGYVACNSKVIGSGCGACNSKVLAMVSATVRHWPWFQQQKGHWSWLCTVH